MSANPYENEPGFEDANEPSDKKNQKDYIQKAWGTMVCKLYVNCTN
jgi:hypothetical protein